MSLDDFELAAPADDDRLLLVHEALDKLAGEDGQCAELVKLRFFVGLNQAEAARLLGLSETTAKRLWAFARAWLFDELKQQV